jgi:putative endonuclease
VRTAGQRQGDAAEAFVAERLAAAGWTILDRNARGGRGELDIVGVDPGPPPELVVVEVRWRGRRDFGLAEETVDRRKQARLHQAAWRWLEARDRDERRLPLRFDLAVVEPDESGGARRVRHHRAAF